MSPSKVSGSGRRQGWQMAMELFGECRGCQFSCLLLSCFYFGLCVPVAGIPPNSLVEAHGTFATATCTVCRRTYPGEDFRVSDSDWGMYTERHQKQSQRV